MAHHALVITDPAKAHAARAHQRASAYLAHGRDQHGNLHREMGTALAQALNDETPPEHGDLWTHVDLDCPLGGTNCRNCGDPEFKDACRAAGHCEQCGVAHGCAPDSRLSHIGVELHPIDPPKSGEVWHRQQKKFVKG